MDTRPRHVLPHNFNFHGSLAAEVELTTPPWRNHSVIRKREAASSLFGKELFGSCEPKFFERKTHLYRKTPMNFARCWTTRTQTLTAEDRAILKN
jgi:hypothetical protein